MRLGSGEKQLISGLGVRLPVGVEVGVDDEYELMWGTGRGLWREDILGTVRIIENVRK